MAATDSLSSSSLRVELRIIGAKNIATKHKGSLFIRCYLPSENNARVQLNTPEIIQSSKKDDYYFWDNMFSLECNGATPDSIKKLKDDSIVFELRWRKTKSFRGTSQSQLLASAEIPWRNVFDAPNMEIQRWVALTVMSSCVLKLEEGAKPPALQFAIKVEVDVPTLSNTKEEMKSRRRAERMKHQDECSCCSCADNELLFVAEALEAF